MGTHAVHHLDRPRFVLAEQISMRLAARSRVEDVRQAVAILTASADPTRAERLRPRPDDAGPLVERLAVWALHHASDDAVRLAARQLSGVDASCAAPGGPNGTGPRERVLARTRRDER